MADVNTIWYDNYVPKYFKEVEFERAQPSCSMKQMDGFLLKKLDDLREACRMPIVITSAYRSSEYEKSKGRSGSSAHCYGCAVDIRCKSSQSRFKVLKNAFALGFSRVGISQDFIHLDVSLTHTDDVVWLYDE